MSKNLRAPKQIPRIKSLIKPPPPRNSWELLLDDYLKDPNLLANLTPKSSPNSPQSYQQQTSPTSPSNFTNSHRTTAAFYPSQQLNYTSCPTCQQKSSFPPRRYEINLDELVYLISQIGRADFYREMVQFIQTQQLSSVTNHSQALNMNACTIETSDESFFLNNAK